VGPRAGLDISETIKNVLALVGIKPQIVLPIAWLEAEAFTYIQC